MLSASVIIAAHLSAQTPYKLRATGSADATGSGNLIIQDNKAGKIRLMIDSTGNMGVGVNKPLAKFHLGGTAGVDGIRFPDGTLQTTAGTPSQWTTAGSAINYGSGNVGVGVAAPTEKLEVAGNVKVSGGITANSINITTLNADNFTVTNDIHAGGTVFASAYSSNSPLPFNAPGGVERMRIDDVSGNVGIGTTAPGKRLHVNTKNIQGEPESGSIRIESQLVTNTVPPGVISNSAWDLEPILPNGSVPARFQIGTPGNPLLTFTQDDGINIKNRLRIGTLSNPPIASVHDLSIHAPLAYSVMQLANSGSGYNEFDGLIMYSIGNDAQFNLSENGNISFLSGDPALGANTAKMTIHQSGNVGIGTSAPTEKLEVNGNIRVNDSYDLLLRNSHHGLGWYGSSTLTPAKQFAGADIDGPVLYGYSGGALASTNDGIGKKIALRWDANGNVGIGTNNPTEKLDVIGIIRACEARVNMTGCDFVFEPDYHLMDLETRMEIVPQQKHLPHIKPAKETEKEGAALGETASGLLRNLEEHELYLYKHHERIKNLEIQNQLLFEKIDVLIKENESLRKEINILKK